MTQDEYDAMLLVKILYQKRNWSIEKIAKVSKEMGGSWNKSKSLYDKALEIPEDTFGGDFPKSGKTIDLRYVGSTSDIEYIEGHINHNVCGGGRKVVQDSRY